MKGLRFDYVNESKPIPNESIDVHADEYWDSVNQELQGITHGKKMWISSAIEKPGSLRKTLGVKKGEKISSAKLKKSEKSKSPLTKKRAVLAETLLKFSK